MPSISPAVVSEDCDTIPTTSMISGHDDNSSTSGPSPVVATKVVEPHDAATNVASDESSDPTAHQHLGQSMHEIFDSAHNLKPRTARDAGEPSFEEKTPRRVIPDRRTIPDLKEQSASYFTSAELYDIYVHKLQQLRETGEPAHIVNEQGKPKVLVRTLIDYLNSYEERMKSVEDKVGIEPKSEKLAKSNAGPDVAGTRFYDVDDQAQAAVDTPDDTEDGWNVPGAFISNVDTNNRIRALFKWKNKPQNQAADTQISPDPKSVDILELRIKSKSVADFFQKEFDYDISKDGLIHLAKPFRCLITKVDLIRQHVNRVREQLRYVATWEIISSPFRC